MAFQTFKDIKFIILLVVISLSTSVVQGQSSVPTPTPIFSTSSPTPLVTPPVPIYTMNEIEVYANKAPGDVLEGPSLDSLKADSRLADLLDSQAGLETEGLGIAKSFANISIRGSATNQTLVLLNGQRTNQGFDLAMIPTEDIERIEIIKGPEALAYGPDATGGVINIITHVQSQGGSFGTSVGDFGTYQAHASTGDWKLGPWQGSLSGNGFNTNGYTANTDLVNWEVDHSSRLRLGADQLTLTANYVYKNGGAPNGDSLAALDTGVFDTDDREKKQAFVVSASDQRALGEWSFNPAFSYNYSYVYRLSPLGADNASGVPPVDENTYNTYDFLATGSAQWDSWFHSLTFGFEFRSENLQGTESLGDGVRSNDVTSFSGKGQLDFTQSLSFRYSGRLDWYNSYGLAVFNPEGTVRYQFTSEKDVYFGAGTGYRYPDFDELYHPEIDYSLLDLPVELGDGETGNPNLQPESSVNLEAGTDWGWNHVSFKISGFASFYNNLIIPAEIQFYSPLLLENAPYWSFTNVPQARVLGFETSLNLDLSSWLSPYASYTFVDSRNTQTNELIPARMRQKAVGGIALKFPQNTEIHLDGQFVDRDPAIYTGFQDNPTLIVASSYTILNADFKTNLAPNQKVFLSLKNILNEQYATLQGLLMPGRYFEIGTTVSF